jgi:glyceraldehyde 3-phosphate dehydrogenase
LVPSYKIQLEDGALLISAPGGFRHEIRFSNAAERSITGIPWIGLPKVVFECSGKFAEFPQKCTDYLDGKTEKVIISATSYHADGTFVFGFNHESFDPNEHKIISYGSCTVNAYVPLAQRIHDLWEVVESDVYVAHNTQEYKLRNSKECLLYRKGCTLEKMGPRLLDWLPQENFLVDYVVGPFTNVSAISFRFKLKDPFDKKSFISKMEEEFSVNGKLHGLYSFDEVDRGDSNAYNCTPFSAVFTKDNIQRRGDNLYLHGYFDNENSVNRLYDLANHIIETTWGPIPK